MIGSTRRLLLRPFTPADLDELAVLLADPEVMKHSLNGVYDRERSAAWLDGLLPCYETYGIGPLALIARDSHALAGFCGVVPDKVQGRQVFNLGYRLAPRYWGLGLAAEAAQEVLRIVFAGPDIDSVVVIIEPDHPASMRVAEKAGFRRFERIVFHDRPVQLYRMSREQWAGQQPSSDASNLILANHCPDSLC